MLLTLLLALLPGPASACGIPLHARISFERALLIVDGPRQQLIATVDLSAAEPDAAVIFPIPATPTVDQPAGADQLFRYLDAATQPRIERKQRYVWRVRESPETLGSAPGVAVLNQQLLGGFEVASLAATDPQALQAWLDQHHYTLPAAAEPILAAYVREGWTFVAVRLAEAAPEGTLSPLRISYSAEVRTYPMRLGALSEQAVGLDLFVLSAHRSEVAALQTTFAGPLSSLDPPPSADLAALLTGAPYLTRMRANDLNPASLSADFTISQAPSDEPYRQVLTVYELVSFAERYGVLSVLLCLAAFSPISFVVALSIRRRIRAIIPPVED